jgi:hypothetical protein
MEDTSLDDFLDISDQTTAESEAATTDDVATEVDDPTEDAGDTGDPDADTGDTEALSEDADDTERHGAVEPTGPPTTQWAADGATCAVCDERVTRRWRDDGRLVCAGCKNWD